jgi:hypothetical protein
MSNMKPHQTLALTLLPLILVAILAAGWLKWRGFRASGTPSAFETGVARSVRDFAIPAKERRRTNPDAGDWISIRRGREDFLARCAVCHDTDAHGRTPIGANLYPRVPDLHLEPTQDLTDGEIHYIIENGIQLTGMPAMGQCASRIRCGKLEARCLHPNLRLSHPRRNSSGNQRVGISALYRLARLPEMPCGDLRALEENTDGEPSLRPAGAPGRHHSRLENQQSFKIHEGPSCSGVRQHLETTVLHQSRRRLLSAPRSMGHR